jgi:glucose/mannose-6-phosphate isomerase
MDLGNENEWGKIDTMGVEKALEKFPDQIKTCWGQAYSANISELSPKSVIVSGMGGSSNAAKILQSLFESKLKIPFEVFNDYGLPAWVDKDTLVVANSYSGNTEETLSAIEVAKKVGAKVLGVATGGKIAEMIRSGEIHGAIISPGETNPTGFPKTGLGVSLGGLAAVLAKAGVLPIKEEEINLALRELIEIRKDWGAKEMAEWLNGYFPILFGGRPFIGAINAGRNAMCEISRNFTQFYDFPEVNHVLIEATTKPEPAKEKFKYLFFESSFNEERVKLRFKITAEIFDEQGLQHKSYQLKASSELGQAFEIAHYCAWLGFYLSILQDTDPGPEPWIIRLKDSLAQPVH